MTTQVTWSGGNADWGDTNPFPWSGGVVPNSNNDVIINTANLYTSTFSIEDNFTVNSLTVGNDHFDMTGGTLEILTTASFAGGFTQSDGSLVGAAAVAMNGSAVFTGGYVAGTLAFQFNAATTLAGVTFGGGVTAVNNGQISQTGQITLGDDTGADVTITNKANTTYSIAGDFGITAGAQSASFVNQGTLAKSAGSATSDVAVSIVDTGAITVTTGGTLEFGGALNSFDGTISGAGTFAVGGGGVDTIESGTVLSAGGLAIFDTATRLTLGESLNCSGSFTQTSGSFLNLNGTTLALTGAASFATASFATPTVDGAGTLITNGTTSIDGLVLGGTVGWQNDGTVKEVGTLTLGDGSGQSVTFTNEAGAVYDLTDDTGVAAGASAASRFVNTGMLADTDGTGLATIAVNVNDSGAIAVSVGGELEFNGAINAFTGTISGGGQFAIAGGNGSTTTIGNGAAITAAFFGIYGNGTQVTLGENLSYAGSFNQANASIIDLNGFKLTLTGPASFAAGNPNAPGTPEIDGSGTLVTKGATSVGGFTLGGTVLWQNFGSISQTDTLTLDDSTGQSVTLTNEAGAVFALTNDTGIAGGPSQASTLINLGALNDTAGNGTATIAVNVQDSGKINVLGGGELEFNGPINSFTGTISGAGQFAVGGGDNSTTTIDSGAVITSSEFGIYNSGTQVTLDENLTYAGAFVEGSGSFLNLGGTTLTLTGAAMFSNLNEAAPEVDGSGVLVTRHTTAINNFILGGTASWQNYGDVSETSTLTLDAASGQAVTVTNEHGAVYELTNDSGIVDGPSQASRFVNAGTLEDTDAIGVADVSVDVTNTGTISIVAYAALQFNGPTNHFAGTISGPGQFILGGGGSSTIVAGTKVSIANFMMQGDGTRLTWNESFTYTGNFAADAGTDLLVAAGKTLTLIGPTSLGGATGGAGKLQIAAGTTYVLNGDSFGVATIGISGKATQVYVNASGSDAGSFIDGAGTTMTLGFDDSLLLAGTADLSGMITGSGTLALGGVVTVSKSALLTVANIAVSAGTTNFSTNFSYGGDFVESGGDIAVSAVTLALNGAATFTGGAVSGSKNGFLATRGNVSLAGLAIEADATWQVYGPVTATGNLVLGNAGGGVGHLTIKAGALYDLIADVGIVAAAGGGGTVVNSGLLEKTSGNGSSVIGPAISNTGTIEVVSGVLEFAGAVSGTGHSVIGSRGELQFDGSVASTQTVTFAATLDGDLNLNDASGTGLSFSGAIHGFVAGDSIDLSTFIPATGGETVRWIQNGNHGTLRITDGSDSTRLSLFGQYAAAGFGIASDGHGGSVVTYTPPPQPASITTPHH